MTIFSRSTARWLRVFSFLAFGSLALAGRLAAQAQGEPIDPDALKRMSLEELMGMEVTSVSRAPEPFGQAPAAIQVITQEQIRRSGVTTIPDALRLATNLNVAQKNSHTWAISARGFNTDLANKLLVLIDGRTVYTPLFSGVFWDRQDYLLEDIERIEVISGPGGTLWGANAVNGVINIITKSAQASQGLYVEGGAGTQLKASVGARYGGSAGSRLSYRLYGTYFDRESEVFPDSTDAGDAWTKSQGGFRADADLTPSDLLTVQGDLYESDQDVPTGGTGKASGGNVLSRWSHSFAGESELSLQLYYDRTHLRSPIPVVKQGTITLAPAGTLGDELDTYDLDLQHHFNASTRNRVVWGLGYRRTHDEVMNAPSLAFDPPVLDRDLFSGFAQNEMAITSGLDLTLGSKVEHNDYTGFEVEPSARLRWNVTPIHTLWAAVSRAVRMPSRVDRDERLPTPGFAPIVNNLIIGNDTFVSETLIAYELGFRGQFGAHLAGSISTFYNRYEDLRSTSTSPPDPIAHLPFPFFFANDLEATTWGGELVANVQIVPSWSLRGGYALLKEELDIREGGMDFNNMLNETADPEQHASLWSSIDLPMGVELDAGFRWVDSFQFNVSGNPSTVPSYKEVEAHLSWSPSDRVAISVHGLNLLHEQHLEYVISGSNPREEIKRSFRANVAVRW